MLGQQTSSEQINVNLPWHSDVFVVKSLSSVLAVYKPCGVRAHPNDNENCRQALLEAPYISEKEAYKIDENYIKTRFYVIFDVF